MDRSKQGPGRVGTQRKVSKILLERVKNQKRGRRQKTQKGKEKPGRSLQDLQSTRGEMTKGAEESRRGTSRFG